MKYLGIIVSGLAIFFCQGLSSANAQPPPSAFDLMRGSDFFGVELSPNGEHLAAIVSTTSKFCLSPRTEKMVPEEKARCKEKNRRYRSRHKLAFFDISADASNSRKVFDHKNTLDLPEDYYVQWAERANNDILLVSVLRPTTVNARGSMIDFGSARLVSINKNNMTTRILAGDVRKISKNRRNLYLNNITDLLRQDPDHILIPANAGSSLHLWKVNILTGHAEIFEEGTRNTFLWVTNKKGQAWLRYDRRNNGRRVDVFK